MHMVVILTDYTDLGFASFNMTQRTILRVYAGCHQVSL